MKAHGLVDSLYHVHHINGNHLDNRLANLISIPQKLHVYIHRQFRKGDVLPGHSWILKYLESNRSQWNGLSRRWRDLSDWRQYV